MAATKAWRRTKSGKELQRLGRSHTHKTSHFLTKKKKIYIYIYIYIYIIYISLTLRKCVGCASPRCFFTL